MVALAHIVSLHGKGLTFSVNWIASSILLMVIRGWSGWDWRLLFVHTSGALSSRHMAHVKDFGTCL